MADPAKTLQYWTIWYPKAAATGLLLARCRVDPVSEVIVHSAPDPITVEVSTEDGARMAFAQDLAATDDSPMTRLRIEGDTVTREEIWPDEGDYGVTVLLPGGEAGVLKAWWNAEDRKSWRWQIEFYNEIG